MRWVYLALVSLSLLPTVAYGVLLGAPWRHPDRRTAWLITSWVWTAGALEARLFFALAGVHLPQWVNAAILVGPAAVAWWRLWDFLRVRRGRC
jgi:hypothetical protein